MAGFDNIITIEPIDEDKLSYRTVTVTVNGVTKKVLVPINTADAQTTNQESTDHSVTSSSLALQTPTSTATAHTPPSVPTPTTSTNIQPVTTTHVSIWSPATTTQKRMRVISQTVTTPSKPPSRPTPTTSTNVQPVTTNKRMRVINQALTTQSKPPSLRLPAPRLKCDNNKWSVVYPNMLADPTRQPMVFRMATPSSSVDPTKPSSVPTSHPMVLRMATPSSSVDPTKPSSVPTSHPMVFRMATPSSSVDPTKPSSVPTSQPMVLRMATPSSYVDPTKHSSVSSSQAPIPSGSLYLPMQIRNSILRQNLTNNMVLVANKHLPSAWRPPVSSVETATTAASGFKTPPTVRQLIDSTSSDSSSSGLKIDSVFSVSKKSFESCTTSTPTTGMNMMHTSLLTACTGSNGNIVYSVDNNSKQGKTTIVVPDKKVVPSICTTSAGLNYTHQLRTSDAVFYVTPSNSGKSTASPATAMRLTTASGIPLQLTSPINLIQQLKTNNQQAKPAPAHILEASTDLCKLIGQPTVLSPSEDVNVASGVTTEKHVNAHPNLLSSILSDADKAVSASRGTVKYMYPRNTARKSFGRNKRQHSSPEPDDSSSDDDSASDKNVTLQKLCVVLTNLDFGPKFKSIKLSKLQTYLRNRRRFRMRQRAGTTQTGKLNPRDLKKNIKLEHFYAHPPKNRVDQNIDTKETTDEQSCITHTTPDKVKEATTDDSKVEEQSCITHNTPDQVKDATTDDLLIKSVKTEPEAQNKENISLLATSTIQLNKSPEVMSPPTTAAPQKKKFLLIKTSTGSYLMPVEKGLSAQQVAQSLLGASQKDLSTTAVSSQQTSGVVGSADQAAHTILKSLMQATGQTKGSTPMIKTIGNSAIVSGLIGQPTSKLNTKGVSLLNVSPVNELKIKSEPDEEETDTASDPDSPVKRPRLSEEETRPAQTSSSPASSETASDRIKRLKEMLKVQEAALETVRKNRETNTFRPDKDD